tara:strand:+ start:171 stop:416 length:246 start_codon:yes stop_codon:yes gene_type:complete
MELSKAPIKIEKLDCLNILEIKQIQQILKDRKDPNLWRTFNMILKICNKTLNSEQYAVLIEEEEEEDDSSYEGETDSSDTE